MASVESVNNQKRTLEVAIADSVNLTGLFSMFITESLIKVLEETLKYVMFPIAAAGGLIQASLAWRQARLDGGKKGPVVRAAVETAAALPIAITVACSLAAVPVFAVAAPYIFAATLTAKMLFHAGSACYYWGKSKATSDPDKQIQYRAAAKANAIGAVSLVLATVAVTAVMILAKPVFTFFGIAAGLIGVGYALYKRCTMPRTAKKPEAASDSEKASLLEPDAAPSEGLTQGARLQQQFAAAPETKTEATKAVQARPVQDPAYQAQPAQDPAYFERRSSRSSVTKEGPAQTVVAQARA